jgi:uncharacterized protein YciI
MGTDPTSGEWKEGTMATPQGRPERFLAYSTAGSQRDLARDAREQPWWDEHAAFIDGLVAEGFIQLGGPLDEEGGGFLVVMAQNEVEARERLRHDPWYAHDILSLVWVKRWRIFIDKWEATSGA